MADDTLSICLLGPSNIGKSQLLAAMVKAADEELYGYQANFRLRITPVDEKLRKAARDGTLPDLIQVGRQRTTDYDDRVADAVAGKLAGTDTSKVPSYEFTFSYRAAVEGQANSQEMTDSMTVYDAAGSHVFPRRGTPEAERSGDDEAAGRELNSRLSQSTGLVIVLPFYGLGAGHIRKGMDRIVRYLARTSDVALARPQDTWPPLQNIAIALHQYERLFMNCGAEAVELALRPEIARHAITHAVSGLEWFKKLCALDTDTGPFKICLLPTSAYGFLPGFGNPNIDPRSAGGNFSFREDYDDPDGSDPPEHEIHPFLAADPFIFAAKGAWKGNNYMIRARDVDAPSARTMPVTRELPAPETMQPASPDDTAYRPGASWEKLARAERYEEPDPAEAEARPLRRRVISFVEQLLNN